MFSNNTGRVNISTNNYTYDKFSIIQVIIKPN